jgi:hypothetical protein
VFLSVFLAYSISSARHFLSQDTCFPRTLACADCKRSEQRRMTDYYRSVEFVPKSFSLKTARASVTKVISLDLACQHGGFLYRIALRLYLTPIKYFCFPLHPTKIFS